MGGGLSQLDIAPRRPGGGASVLLIMALICLAPVSGVAQNSAAISFEGRAVTEVLAEYESRGHRFLYSTGLVRPSLRFSEEPPAGDDLWRLRTALAPLGLTLQQNSAGLNVVGQLPPAGIAQTVRGRVLDADTGRPLSGVRVEIADQVTVTDESGQFRFQLDAPANIRVSLPGYEPAALVGTPPVAQPLEIPLAPARLMDEIVVVSSRYAMQASERSAYHVDLADIQSIPRLGEDPLRVTNHLPGMSSIGVSAKPHIRGGLQDEMLVLFNNLELLEPFHLRDFQSVFSSFNPSLVGSIDVYTGGFPARYGDRMSGVMDIQSNPEPAGRGGELALSLLNASFLAHGAADQRDWMLSARRGNLDIVAKEINSSVGEPAYSDYFGQLRFDLDDVTELDLGFIGYNDDIELRDYDVDGEIATSRYRNLYTWVQLHRTWSPRFAGSTLLYHGDIAHDRDGLLVDDDLDNGEAVVDDRRKFSLWNFTQRFDYSVGPGFHTQFGLRYAYQTGRYDYNGFIERGELAALLGTDIVETRRYRLRPEGASGGLFTTLRLQPVDPLILELGLRWDFQDYMGFYDSQFSPRLSARYELGRHTEVRFSAGRFFQPEGIHELQIGDGIDSYQDVQYADHYIAAWQHRFSDTGFSMRVEAFSKRFRNPKARYENLFDPMVLLPELASDRVRIEPGRARARGVEASLRYTRGERLLTWLNYSRIKSEDRIGRRWEHRAWDQGDSLSAGFNWRARQWTVSATLLWHDGWRTTRLPAVIVEDEPLRVRRNAARLRDYISLDLQISRMWRWPRQSLTAFLEVTNLLSRRNVGGIEYDIEADEDNPGTFLLSNEPEELLPLVPSVGIRWNF